VASSLEVGVLQEMALLAAVSGLGRTVPRAVSHAAVAATAPCRMLVLARENTSRRRRTNMLGMGEISM